MSTPVQTLEASLKATAAEPTAFRIMYFTSPDIGFRTLMGVNGNFPFSTGNSFSFLNPDNDGASLIERCTGPRVVNMWFENLFHLFSSGIPKVRALVFGEAPDWLAFIEDDSVPSESLNQFLVCTAHSVKYLPAVEAYSGLKKA